MRKLVVCARACECVCVCVRVRVLCVCVCVCVCVIDSAFFSTLIIASKKSEKNVSDRL